MMESVDKETLKRLKKISNSLKPQFNIGKSGLGSKIIENIDRYLEVHNVVKIKCLTTRDKTETEYFAKEIAKETKSYLLEIKGFTFTLFRENE